MEAPGPSLTPLYSTCLFDAQATPALRPMSLQDRVVNVVGELNEYLIELKNCTDQVSYGKLYSYFFETKKQLLSFLETKRISDNMSHQLRQICPTQQLSSTNKAWEEKIENLVTEVKQQMTEVNWMIGGNTQNLEEFQKLIIAYKSSFLDVYTEFPCEEDIEKLLTVCLSSLSHFQIIPTKNLQKLIASIYIQLKYSKRLNELKKLRDDSTSLCTPQDIEAEKELKSTFWPVLAILRIFDQYASSEDREYLDEITTFYSRNYHIPIYTSRDSNVFQEIPVDYDLCFVLISPLDTIKEYIKTCIDTSNEYLGLGLEYLPYMINVLEKKRLQDELAIAKLFEEVAEYESNHEFELSSKNFLDYIRQTYKAEESALEYVYKYAIKFYNLAFKSTGVVFSSNTYALAGYNYLRKRDYDAALQAFDQAIMEKMRLESEEKEEEVSVSQGPLPFWTFLMLSMTHYHLGNYTEAKVNIGEYLKVLPNSHASSEHTNFINKYTKKLTDLEERELGAMEDSFEDSSSEEESLACHEVIE